MAGGNKANSPKTKKRKSQQLVKEQRQADAKRRMRSQYFSPARPGQNRDG
jgi:hypothetical protein